MAVFRIDKKRDYTVMANHHLKNKKISLRAKGLLSVVLSLPGDWDYTLAGLTRICIEGIDCIRSAVHELEAAGYIERTRVRNAKGQLKGTDYTIREIPLAEELNWLIDAHACSVAFSNESEDIKNVESLPVWDGCEEKEEHKNTHKTKDISKKPTFTQPASAELASENPAQEKAMQLNTKNIKDDLKANTQSINPSVTPSVHPAWEQERRTDGRIERVHLYSPPDITAEREQIREQIGYDGIAQEHPSRVSLLDECVEIMLEITLARHQSTRIGRDIEYPTSLVKERYAALSQEHIETVITSIMGNTTKVKNTKAYIIAALFNAATTLDHHYTFMVNHDLYGERD